jgi:hypothetical protein
MELASMLAEERFSDRPSSVCPVIGSILRVYNDNLEDGLRGDLYRYAAEAVGTRAGFAVQLRRAELALEWASDRHEARRRTRLRKRPRQPDPDWSPELIAEHVVGSLGRRITAEAHGAMLGLMDRLIALGIEREVVEQLPNPVEHGGRREELVVADPLERGAPARLDLLPALLDYRAPALGQRREHHALVLS